MIRINLLAEITHLQIFEYNINMKLFDLNQAQPRKPAHLLIQKQAVQMIIEICKTLEVSLPAMHAALWVFHCNAIVMEFHAFDRYVYACGAVLIGTKLMENLKYPTQILGTCRKILRKRKNLQADEDSEQYLKKEVKQVFEAEVTIMINIGFDFDLRLGIHQADMLGLFQQSSLDNFSVKLKQTLTSLYLTEVVVLFDPQVIALLALKILLKVENRTLQAMGLTEQIKNKLQQEQVRAAQKEYLQRCLIN